MKLVQVSSISGSSSDDEDEAKPALHRSPQTVFLNAGQCSMLELHISSLLARADLSVLCSPCQLPTGGGHVHMTVVS